MLRLAMEKLQRAGAVQDAPRCSEILAPREASWTAVVLYRFLCGVGKLRSNPARMAQRAAPTKESQHQTGLLTFCIQRSLEFMKNDRPQNLRPTQMLDSSHTMKYITQTIGIGIVLTAAGCSTGSQSRNTRVADSGVKISWTEKAPGKFKVHTENIEHREH